MEQETRAADKAIGRKFVKSAAAVPSHATHSDLVMDLRVAEMLIQLKVTFLKNIGKKGQFLINLSCRNERYAAGKKVAILLVLPFEGKFQGLV